MQDRKLERIGPFEAKPEKHSIFCIECGEPATKVGMFYDDRGHGVEEVLWSMLSGDFQDS